MNTNAENAGINLSCFRGWELPAKESVVQNVALQNQLSSSQCSCLQAQAVLNAKAASAPPVKSHLTDWTSSSIEVLESDGEISSSVQEFNIFKGED
jgi:hypothetical protein